MWAQVAVLGVDEVELTSVRTAPAIRFNCLHVNDQFAIFTVVDVYRVCDAVRYFRQDVPVHVGDDAFARAQSFVASYGGSFEEDFSALDGRFNVAQVGQMSRALRLLVDDGHIVPFFVVRDRAPRWKGDDSFNSVSP